VTRTEVESAIEELIARFAKLPVGEYLDALDEMAMRADTAGNAMREDMERENMEAAIESSDETES
jgi:hypothetical protein